MLHFSSVDSRRHLYMSHSCGRLSFNKALTFKVCLTTEYCQKGSLCLPVNSNVIWQRDKSFADDLNVQRSVLVDSRVTSLLDLLRLSYSFLISLCHTTHANYHLGEIYISWTEVLVTPNKVFVK